MDKIDELESEIKDSRDFLIRYIDAFIDSLNHYWHGSKIQSVACIITIINEADETIKSCQKLIEKKESQIELFKKL